MTLFLQFAPLWEKYLVENVWRYKKILIISTNIPIIWIRILYLTRKFWFVHFQVEFWLIQPDIFLRVRFARTSCFAVPKLARVNPEAALCERFDDENGTRAASGCAANCYFKGTAVRQFVCPSLPPRCGV